MVFVRRRCPNSAVTSQKSQWKGQPRVVWVGFEDQQDALVAKKKLRLGLMDSPMLSVGSVQAAKLRQAVLIVYGPDKAFDFHRPVADDVIVAIDAATGKTVWQVRREVPNSWSTPILAKARKVVFVSVAESDDDVTDALHDLARQFGWNGVSTEVRVFPPSGRRIAPALALPRLRDRRRGCGDGPSSRRRGTSGPAITRSTAVSGYLT